MRHPFGIVRNPNVCEADFTTITIVCPESSCKSVYNSMERAKARRLSIRFALLLNTGLWLWFWASFFVASRPYPQPVLASGDAIPANVVFYREGGVEGSLAPPTTVQIANLPSWFVAHSFGSSAAERWPVLMDKLFLGCSMGGYIVLGTMCLSYLQWYLYAVLLSRVWPTNS